MLAAGVTIFAGSALIAVPLASESPPADPPPGPGLDLIQRSCIGCHDIYMITTKRKTAEDWSVTVGLMADRGAEVTPDEMQIIEEYLAQNFSVAGTGSVAAQ